MKFYYYFLIFLQFHLNLKVHRKKSTCTLFLNWELLSLKIHIGINVLNIRTKLWEEKNKIEFIEKNIPMTGLIV